MAMIATMEEYQERCGKVTDFTTKDGECSIANSEKIRTTKKLDVVDMRKTFCERI